MRLTTRSSEQRLAARLSCIPRLSSPASVAELESVRLPARHPMNGLPLIAVGTIGWVIAFVRSTTRGSSGWFAPFGIVLALLLSIPIIDVWAMWPEQLVRLHPDDWWPLPLLWAAAVLPYCWLLLRFVRQKPTTPVSHSPPPEP